MRDLTVFPPETRKRDPWKPGESGNPLGRDGKLKARILRYARGKSLKMIKLLVDIADDTENSAVVRKDAAIAVINRAWGAPRQEIEIADAGATLEEMLIAIWREKHNDTNVIENDDELSADGMAPEVYNDVPATNNEIDQ